MFIVKVLVFNDCKDKNARVCRETVFSFDRCLECICAAPTGNAMNYIWCLDFFTDSCSSRNAQSSRFPPIWPPFTQCWTHLSLQSFQRSLDVSCRPSLKMAALSYQSSAVVCVFPISTLHPVFYPRKSGSVPEYMMTFSHSKPLISSPWHRQPRKTAPSINMIQGSLTSGPVSFLTVFLVCILWPTNGFAVSPRQFHCVGHVSRITVYANVRGLWPGQHWRWCMRHEFVFPCCQMLILNPVIAAFGQAWNWWDNPKKDYSVSS